MSPLPDEPLEQATERPQPPAPVTSSDDLTPLALEAKMRWAMYLQAEKMAASTVPAETAQIAEALLRASQAIVILDPALVAPAGVPRDALIPPKPGIKMDKEAPTASRPQG